MASLVSTLNKASSERLYSLATAWALAPTGTDNRILMRAILTKVTDMWHLRCKLEELGEAERQVLFHLADSFEHWLTSSELAQYCRLKGYDAPPAIENLSNLGLVIVDDWQEFQKLTSPLRRLTRYPQPARGETAVALPIELVPEITSVSNAMDQGDITRVPMSAFLANTSARDLQSVAQRWSIPRPHALPKQKLIATLLTAMAKGPGAWTACQWYSPQTAKLLGIIQEKGGKATIAELLKEFGEDLHQTYLELNYAMVLNDTYVDSRRFLYIPPEIRAALAVKTEGGRKSPTTVQPTGEPIDSHLAFVEDLNTLMNFTINNSIELTTTGYIHQRILAKIASLFHVKAEGTNGTARLNFIIESSVKLRLITGTGPRLGQGDSVEDWIHLSIAEQVKRLLNTWLAASRFEIPSGLEYFSPRISWPNARSRVLKHLAANCKVGEWYYLQSFAEFVAKDDQDILGSGATAAEIRRYSLISRIDVDKTIASFVANVIAFPLHWLGLVSLARMSADADSALCFSLTPMGAWALDVPGGTPPPEPTEKPLIVQPNFEILSIAAGGQVLRTLSGFADLTGSDKARTYTMAKASILRGIDDGLSADGIVDFLNNNAQKEIPQNVAYSIRDWARQYAPLSLSTATLVEVESEHVLSELMASTRFSSYFARRLSPNAAIINPGADLRKLANELRKRGYSPHLTGDLPPKSR